MRTLLSVVVLGLSFAANAHHSFTEFDQRKVIEVAGTLTDVAWQNPHVKLKVTSSESGRPVTWDIECHSVGVLSRSNLNPQLLKAGQQVKIAGNPSRASPGRMFATNLLLASGAELIIAPGMKSHWPAQPVASAPVRVATATAPATAPAGLFKVWGSAPMDPTAGPFALWSGEMPLTAAAKKALAAWDPVYDTVARDCVPKGMPTIMEQPYGMQFEDHGNTIVLRIEEYDTVRTIHLADGAAAPREKSLLGYSTGSWEGRDLVVKTTGISWPYISPAGVPQGPSSQMVERFSPTADGRRLEYSVTITDPDTFTVPAVLKRAWVWNPAERVQNYACGKRRVLGQ